MIVVVAVLVVLALAVASFALLRDSNGSASSVRTEDAVRTLPESPGSSATVDIDTTLYLPDTDGPVPAVLLAHGFGGDKNSVAAQARDLASRGLVVLAYSARGFGLSTGSIGLNDPDREVADARGLIDYLATRPEVQLDSRVTLGSASPVVPTAARSRSWRPEPILASTRTPPRSRGTT